MYTKYTTKARPFIAMLGKARFWSYEKTSFVINSKEQLNRKTNKPENFDYNFFLRIKGSNRVIRRSYDDTYELFSNLLYRNCNLGFITEGYKGIHYPSLELLDQVMN